MSSPIGSTVIARCLSILTALAIVSGVGFRAAPVARAENPAPAVAPPAAPAEAEQPDKPAPIDGKAIAAILGVTGELKNAVYHVTVPRDDLNVNVEGMFIPTEAGLSSVFHFWVCPCGKTVMCGQFCVADYEANDVVDALRAAHVRVTSVSNLFIGESPKLMAVRFYEEGDATEMAKAIKAALKNTGEARNAKQPLK